ncbi:MAG: hypothetical protein AB7P04_08070 [Bacteriovoracia bacterium]
MKKLVWMALAGVGFAGFANAGDVNPWMAAPVVTSRISFLDSRLFELADWRFDWMEACVKTSPRQKCEERLAKTWQFKQEQRLTLELEALEQALDAYDRQMEVVRALNTKDDRPVCAEYLKRYQKNRATEAYFRLVAGYFAVYEPGPDSAKRADSKQAEIGKVRGNIERALMAHRCVMPYLASGRAGEAEPVYESVRD